MRNDFLGRVAGFAVILLVLVFVVAILIDAISNHYMLPDGLYPVMSAVIGVLGALLVARGRNGSSS